VQTPLVNFARKEIYKSEVQQEIALRSPGLGSTRPSMGNLVGHFTAQMPYLQRQLSSSSIAASVFYFSVTLTTFLFGCNRSGTMSCMRKIQHNFVLSPEFDNICCNTRSKFQGLIRKARATIFV
jgi:hypothetical protein